VVNIPESEVVGTYMSRILSEGAEEDSCEEDTVVEDDTKDVAESKAGSISPVHAMCIVIHREI
jgi:hypothetical protein